MTTETVEAVKLMRQLRDALGEELLALPPEERLAFIRDRALTTELGRRLAADRSAPAAGEAKPSRGAGSL